jgi:hypothetical protein
MNLLKPIIFSSLIVGLSACGAKNANDAKVAAQNVERSPVTVQQAKYASKCGAPRIKAEGIFLSSKTTFELSELKFTKTDSYYSDLNCTTESFLVVATGTTAVVNHPAAGEATQEDFTFQKVTAKSMGDLNVKWLNTEKLCGLTNWAVGQEQDVSANSAECVNQSASFTAQELVLVKDNQLFLGAAMEKAQRPDKIDSSTPYTKEN